MDYSDVFMANGNSQWRDGNCITLTFCVTEDCNLACKYCYMVGKNNKRVMSYETAKKIVDSVLNDEYICQEDAVIWDFIGGEPLLEIDLIDKLCDYIVVRMYALGHKWFMNYRFSFSTNGTLFHKQNVQDFINKHKGHVWFTISIDGTKEKHDLSRIKKDGSGSYDDVIKNIPLWLKHFPNASTKATFAHEDIPYLKDSIIHIWNLGIKDATANVVYEDVWEEGDDIIYENQLKELADYVIDNRLWDEVSTTFFNSRIGLPVDNETLNRNKCAAGDKSLAFDCDGNYYPCIRFLEMCFSNKEKIIVGNYITGVNLDYLRSFKLLSWKNQSDFKCNNCEVGMGCGWCIANNYEISNKDTIYERSTSLCKMHHANARANQYFWKRYTEVTQKTSPYTLTKISMLGTKSLKFMYFITSDNITPHCSYENKNKGENKMTQDILNEGINYCINNSLVPVFLGKCEHNLVKCNDIYYDIIDSNDTNISIDDISIYKNNYELSTDNKIAILLANKNNIQSLVIMLKQLFIHKDRINLFIQDLSDWNECDFNVYRSQLMEVIEIIQTNYKANNMVQLNILTDYFLTDENVDCNAGVNSISLAPNGKFYICPAFYFEDYFNIGDLEHGVNDNYKQFCLREKSPTCSDCNVNICNRCLFLNKKCTRELHVSSYNQCKVNNIQKEISGILEGILFTENKNGD